MQGARARFAFPHQWLDVERLPRMVSVALTFPKPSLDDVEAATRTEIARSGMLAGLERGARVAIGVGSRGVASLAELVRATVRAVRAAGGEPFVVPAMGSHGGANAEGQEAVLAALGVTEASVGAPVRSQMGTVKVGTLPSGIPVYMDALAAAADGIIVVNRVKPHTDFRGPVESGLLKMLVIGLGKHTGATAYHAQGFDRFHELIPQAGRFVLQHARVLGGVATVENAAHQVAVVRAMGPDRMEQVERELLARAKELLPTLPFDEFHVLLVDRLGKDVSGAGMDPNVTGRFPPNAGVREATRPVVERIAVMDLTPGTHGNAIGIGMADVVTARLVDAMDVPATYANVLTNGLLEVGRVPMVMPDDRYAFAAALRGCKRIEPEQAHVVRIASTLELSHIQVSETLLRKIADIPHAQVLGDARPPQFDSEGRLEPL